MDEVDVFFGKDFYGQTYNQVTDISTPELTALIKRIWKERSLKPNIRTLARCSEYQKLVNDFPQWKFLIDNELKLMCSQVNSFDQPSYTYNVQTDQIGYKVLDTISYTLSYGHRTMFAYMSERDKGNVKSNHTANFDQKHLRMQVSCGQFSYANISPSCILGVSGTLKAMMDYEREIMCRKPFQMNLYSIAPSVYGPKALKFSKALSTNGREGISIKNNKAEYFKGIVDAINSISRTPDASKLKHRAVIVFFESFERMTEFQRSESYRQVIANTAVNILSEKTSKDDRDHIIKKAATAGQITLATKVFGRGTDFISRDTQLNDRGGTHIVQTFLSEMLSEEIQIQGRTARQGQEGSYSLVLLEEDALEECESRKNKKRMVPRKDTLAYFDIQPDELERKKDAGDVYQYLCQKRVETRAREAAQIEENLVVANDRDKTTRAYFAALLNNRFDLAKHLFKQMYMALKGTVGSEQVSMHIVFMLDESGSMQGELFEELKKAYNDFVAQRLQHGGEEDRLTVINFSSKARYIGRSMPFSSAPILTFNGGNTNFAPPLQLAQDVLSDDARSHGSCLIPILILMTDGGCGDLTQAMSLMRSIDATFKDKNMQVHFVAFGAKASTAKLESLKSVCTDGHIHTSAMGDLAATFKEIEESLVIAEYN